MLKYIRTTSVQRQFLYKSIKYKDNPSMSENIGKLTTPNNDGDSIEVDSNLIKINNPLEF